MYCLIFKKYKEKQNLKASRTSNGIIIVMLQVQPNCKKKNIKDWLKNKKRVEYSIICSKIPLFGDILPWIQIKLIFLIRKIWLDDVSSTHTRSG